MTPTEQPSFLEELLACIDSKELALPTLPDAAFKLRKLIDDQNVSASQIVLAVSGDPAIAAQVVKMANSAAFTGKPPVASVKDAVSRLGYRLLHNIVLALTVGEMFRSANPVINQRLKSFWEHSRRVAAISYVIALRQKHLQPEHAMMAGLIHDIGTLPVCLFAAKKGMSPDAETLESLIRKCHEQAGRRLLKSWNFPQDLIDVAAEHEDFHRDGERADYVDVVAVANPLDMGAAKITAWDNVAAAKRLGMSQEDCRSFLERFAEQVSTAQSMLGIAKPAATTEADSAKAPASQAASPFGSSEPTGQPKKPGLFSALSGLLGK